MNTPLETKSNLQIIQNAFADFMSGNIQSIIDTCTEDIFWTGAENPGVRVSGTFNGKDEVVIFFKFLAEDVDYSIFEPKEFFSDKDAVIVVGHQTAKVKKTGKTFDHDWCMIFKLRDGKIYHYHIFVDTRDQGEAFKS